jgi:hypothetical protein
VAKQAIRDVGPSDEPVLPLGTRQSESRRDGRFRASGATRTDGPIRSDKSPHQVKQFVGRFTQRLDPKRWDRTTGTGAKSLGHMPNMAFDPPLDPDAKSLRRNTSI